MPMTRTCWFVVMLTGLTAGGCMFGPFKSLQTENSPAQPIEAKDLRPGMYCEFDMRMPPTADPDAYRCYLGTVQEVTAEDVLMTDAIEESWEDYAPWCKTSPKEIKHGTMRIPLTGVICIGVTHPPKKFAAVQSGAAPAATLPATMAPAGTSTAALPSTAAASADAAHVP